MASERASVCPFQCMGCCNRKYVLLVGIFFSFFFGNSMVDDNAIQLDSCKRYVYISSKKYPTTQHRRPMQESEKISSKRKYRRNQYQQPFSIIFNFICHSQHQASKQEAWQASQRVSELNERLPACLPFSYLRRSRIVYCDRKSLCVCFLPETHTRTHNHTGTEIEIDRARETHTVFGMHSNLALHR